MYDFLVVGAGFAGSVIAERLASQLDKKILVVEKRNHIGGNAYDEYDENGILIHKYGPHIFHTNSKKVFDYLSNFTEWRFYEHKVLAVLNGELYPIPINRLTINKLYGLNFQSEKEVTDYFEKVREKRSPILNSEDIIVDQVGYDLFDKFFKNYTKKQWGFEPRQLSPLVCGRVPVRTNDDCRYFTDIFQFMPKAGYTKMFEKILGHKNIEVMLNTDYKTILNSVKFNKIIYTGPIDYFFEYEFGRLPYRSINFKFHNYNMEFYQPNPVINHVDSMNEYTRVTEYKYLTGQTSNSTSVSFEYTINEGEPYYPIPNDENRKLYLKYKGKANKEKNAYFCGRLAEYQYYNMDQVVANILNLLLHEHVK